MQKYINLKNLNKAFANFAIQKPFPYAVVDNFFKNQIAKKLENEFPKYNDKNLHSYKNYCEVKKSSNNWNLFPPLTYEIFRILNSEKITKLVGKKINIKKLLPDFGLNGGGWHMMYKMGKLNPHLDYSMHPKFFAQRKINLIIFLTNKWKNNWGGELSLYEKNHNNDKMQGKLIKKISPKFNRAVFFDTSKTSWHGVEPIKTKKVRKSIAVYYLVIPKKNDASTRQRALYSPIKNQINNKKVLNFIKLRSSISQSYKVYKT